MQIAIKNPATQDPNGSPWGDEYFGAALARELEAKGCAIRHQFWPNWDSEVEDDVVIVLRGLRQWQPPAGTFSILWIVSHPADVNREEIDAFDLVLTASSLHADMLRAGTRTPIRVARQCTDHRIFQIPERTIEEDSKKREGIVYVARSRGVRRDMAQWLAETDLNARIFGNGWERYGLGHLVEAQHVVNEELPAIYRKAWLGLNDHWVDMRGYGYINNRILDCLACGLPVVTDEFPEIRKIFGSSLLYANDANELMAAISRCRDDYRATLSECREKWIEVGKSFTFEYRSSEIVEWIRHPPAGDKGGMTYELPAWNRCGVEVIRNCTYHEQQRAKYLERKILDLNRTNEELNKRLRVVHQSLSWRMTRPLRSVSQIFRALVRRRVDL